MIIVSGTFHFAPNDHAKLLHAMDRVETATRAEPGCRTYTFYMERDDNCRFRVYEEWDSWETLETHGKSAHIAEFRQALNEIGVLERNITASEVGKSKQL